MHQLLLGKAEKSLERLVNFGAKSRPGRDSLSEYMRARKIQRDNYLKGLQRYHLIILLYEEVGRDLAYLEVEERATECIQI